MSQQTPDITDCFSWRGSSYRATAYTKTVTVELSPLMARLLGKTHVQKEVFCVREEATRVCGAGVAGCDAPIEEITNVEPMSGWSQEAIEEERATAMRLVGASVY